MRIDRSFRWLGRFPLAVDLADTVRVVGSSEVDLLDDDESLFAWIARETDRFPVAVGAAGHLSEVRVLRDAVRDLLLARAGGSRLPEPAVDIINQASARCPSYEQMTGEGRTLSVEISDDPYELFAAAVARSTMTLLTGPLGRELRVCRAPSCGMFFIPENRRQKWCSPECGNRARVARHASRSSQERPS